MTYENENQIHSLFYNPYKLYCHVSDVIIKVIIKRQNDAVIPY